MATRSVPGTEAEARLLYLAAAFHSASSSKPANFGSRGPEGRRFMAPGAPGSTEFFENVLLSHPRASEIGYPLCQLMPQRSGQSLTTPALQLRVHEGPLHPPSSRLRPTATAPWGPASDAGMLPAYSAPRPPHLPLGKPVGATAEGPRQPDASAAGDADTTNPVAVASSAGGWLSPSPLAEHKPARLPNQQHESRQEQEQEQEQAHAYGHEPAKDPGDVLLERAGVCPTPVALLVLSLATGAVDASSTQPRQQVPVPAVNGAGGTVSLTCHQQPLGPLGLPPLSTSSAEGMRSGSCPRTQAVSSDPPSSSSSSTATAAAAGCSGTQHGGCGGGKSSDDQVIAGDSAAAKATAVTAAPPPPPPPLASPNTLFSCVWLNPSAQEQLLLDSADEYNSVLAQMCVRDPALRALLREMGRQMAAEGAGSRAAAGRGGGGASLPPSVVHLVPGAPGGVRMRMHSNPTTLQCQHHHHHHNHHHAHHSRMQPKHLLPYDLPSQPSVGGVGGHADGTATIGAIASTTGMAILSHADSTNSVNALMQTGFSVLRLTPCFARLPESATHHCAAVMATAGLAPATPAGAAPAIHRTASSSLPTAATTAAAAAGGPEFPQVTGRGSSAAGFAGGGGGCLQGGTGARLGTRAGSVSRLSRTASVSQELAAAAAAAAAGAAAAAAEVPGAGAAAGLSEMLMERPALLVEHLGGTDGGDPTLVPELYERLQRDCSILSGVSAIITLFDVYGAVVHQNALSVEYLGLHRPPPAMAAAAPPPLPSSVTAMSIGGAGGGSGGSVGGGHFGGGPSPLELLFQFDPHKLHEMLAAVLDGRSWTSIVQVPASLVDDGDGSYGYEEAQQHALGTGIRYRGGVHIQDQDPDPLDELVLILSYDGRTAGGLERRAVVGGAQRDGTERRALSSGVCKADSRYGKDVRGGGPFPGTSSSPHSSVPAGALRTVVQDAAAGGLRGSILQGSRLRHGGDRDLSFASATSVGPPPISLSPSPFPSPLGSANPVADSSSDAAGCPAGQTPRDAFSSTESPASAFPPVASASPSDAPDIAFPEEATQGRDVPSQSAKHRVRKRSCVLEHGLFKYLFNMGGSEDGGAGSGSKAGSGSGSGAGGECRGGSGGGGGGGAANCRMLSGGSVSGPLAAFGFRSVGGGGGGLDGERAGSGLLKRSPSVHAGFDLEAMTTSAWTLVRPSASVTSGHVPRAAQRQQPLQPPRLPPRPDTAGCGAPTSTGMAPPPPPAAAISALAPRTTTPPSGSGACLTASFLAARKSNTAGGTAGSTTVPGWGSTAVASGSALLLSHSEEGRRPSSGAAGGTGLNSPRSPLPRVVFFAAASVQRVNARQQQKQKQQKHEQQGLKAKQQPKQEGQQAPADAAGASGDDGASASSSAPVLGASKSRLHEGAASGDGGGAPPDAWPSRAAAALDQGAEDEDPASEPCATAQWLRLEPDAANALTVPTAASGPTFAAVNGLAAPCGVVDNADRRPHDSAGSGCSAAVLQRSPYLCDGARGACGQSLPSVSEGLNNADNTGTERKVGRAAAAAAVGGAGLLSEEDAKQQQPQQQDEAQEEHQEQEEGLVEARWHEVTARPFRDPVSRRRCILLMQMDVTAKVETERRLAELVNAEHKILEQIFPRHVLEHMAHDTALAAQRPACAFHVFRRDSSKLATKHAAVTILFADIKGFTSMCQEVEPEVVMAFLNELYNRFDTLLDVYGVYKVETIGDCYMVAGGLIRKDEEGFTSVHDPGAVDPLHAVRVMSFAKAMLREAGVMRMPVTGEALMIRVGIHSGPVMSGVAGTRMPRFCLFGDTVNTASRMESTATPGTIHVSANTRRLLPNEEWEPTGGVEVKGKGLMHTFVWLGNEEESAPHVMHQVGVAGAAAAAPYPVRSCTAPRDNLPSAVAGLRRDEAAAQQPKRSTTATREEVRSAMRRRGKTLMGKGLLRLHVGSNSKQHQQQEQQQQQQQQQQTYPQERKEEARSSAGGNSRPSSGGS